jgi:hypothetical protein
VFSVAMKEVAKSRKPERATKPLSFLIVADFARFLDSYSQL